jgi:hypothetical protein
VSLRNLVGRAGDVWRSAENVFETERAIRVGRLVADEMRAGLPPFDILVD